MKSNRRWLVCATVGVIVAPILYVFVQGLWAFALGDIIAQARSFSNNLGRFYLKFHSAIGAVLVAAIIGFPLGVFGRVNPIPLGFIVSGSAAVFLLAINYSPEDGSVLLYLSKELPVFVFFSTLFCFIGSKRITRSSNLKNSYEFNN
jgi:hypothetical protein